MNLDGRTVDADLHSEGVEAGEVRWWERLVDNLSLHSHYEASVGPGLVRLVQVVRVVPRDGHLCALR